MKHLRAMLDNRDASTSKYPIINQHKYLPTHMKYNVFVWRQSGYKRTEILKMLNQSYKYYDTRVPKDESSVRRCLRNGERLILDTSKGVF